jgi:hypothetical protein
MFAKNERLLFDIKNIYNTDNNDDAMPQQLAFSCPCQRKRKVVGSYNDAHCKWAPPC